MIEEGVADGVGEGFGFVEGVDVTDDGFIGFEDAEGIAEDAMAMERDEAGKDAALDVFEEKIRGPGVVPLKALVPAAGFIGEEWTELARVEVTEVENLDFLGIEGCGAGLGEGGQRRSGS